MLILLAFVSCDEEAKKAGNIENKINNGWSYQKAGEDARYPASVPGCIHTDLMAMGQIPDPFYLDNEKLVQWVEQEDWIYSVKFDVGDSILSKERIELVFDGLDTYADVKLNGSELLTADNMFRKWSIPVKGALNDSANLLEIHFRSPVKINAEKAGRLCYRLPEERAFSRKAPYQFGWDWGPRLVTSGIWRPVSLNAWDKAHITSEQVTTKSLSDEMAIINAAIEIESTGYHRMRLNLKISGQKAAEHEAELRPGSNIVRVPLEIKNPRLWWPRGYGDPHLYHLSMELWNGDVFLEGKEASFGIRTAELITQPDSIGESFYFRVNGVPVFAKGANYIPQHSFPAAVKKENYESIIEEALFANMNMLRIWGGGIYEDDIFYELCDKNGLMVWQDFMFACTMYPGDSAFLENVRLEVRDNIRRLRNHPSIVVWCGNNEVDEGWHNWGWQKKFGYTTEDSTEIWKAYLDVFHDILPEEIKRLDATRAYWPSSPSIGWGHPESLQKGDSHYWGVWWGEEPFEVYEEKVGRFMSEYGFQGMPPVPFLEKYLGEENLALDAPVLRSHQKHPRGMELIQGYMEKEYNVPQEFGKYNYVSQVLQAEGISLAIEAHRRAKPRCMGTLYWQLNDCWPVISWSSIDHDHNRKALHYFVNKSYRDVLVSTAVEKNTISIHIVNDRLSRLEGNLKISLLNFDGTAAWENSIPVSVSENSQGIYYSLPADSLLAGNDANAVLLLSELTIDGEEFIDIHYFSPPKDLILTEPGIRIDQTTESGRVMVKLSCDYLAKNVFLEAEGAPGKFSDNFFDLIPGREKRVVFLPGTPLKGKLKLRIEKM